MAVSGSGPSSLFSCSGCLFLWNSDMKYGLARVISTLSLSRIVPFKWSSLRS